MAVTDSQNLGLVHGPETQTFPRFQSLPLELRLRIYELTIAPRLIPIFAYSLSSQDVSFIRSTFSSVDTWQSPAYLERFFTSTAPRSITPLFHVNQEARDFVLSRRFTAISSAKTPEKYSQERSSLRRHDSYVYGRHGMNPHAKSAFYLAVPLENRHQSLIDPKHDVLSLEDLNLPRNKVTLSTIDVVVRWADTNCLYNLRRLAIPYYTWRKASICRYLSRLMEFKALEELYITFLGCEATHRQGTDWLSQVGGYDPYFGDMKKQVLDDFEELAKKFPSWRKPAIRFVKDKAELLEELRL